ncbi:MAG: hypothetical protein Q8S84_00615 [bacterium]|nr:hypothetical protein [bacterium]MDP3380090.1 hypothetical protein [bacterium]
MLISYFIDLAHFVKESGKANINDESNNTAQPIIEIINSGVHSKILLFETI